MNGPRHDAVRRSYDAVAEDYAAGFRDELERVSYPGEVDTRRGYLLARRPA